MITVFMFDELMNWFAERFEKSCCGDAFRPVLFVPFRIFSTNMRKYYICAYLQELEAAALYCSSFNEANFP
jgi:hypothetical protein